MKAKGKDVSVQICSHRAPDTLLDTLRSIGSQACLDRVEVILVNNGFSGEKEEAARAFVRSQGGEVSFQIVREARPGLRFARRAGFAAADGRFVVLLDDDNTIGDGFFTNLLEIVSRFDALGGICPAIEPLWEARPDAWLVEFGKCCLSYNSTEGQRPDFEDGYWPPEVAHGVTRPPGGGMIISAQVAEHYMRNFVEPAEVTQDRALSALLGTMAEDYDLWSRLLQLKLPVYTAPRLKVYHRIPKSRTAFRSLLRYNYKLAYVNRFQERVLHGDDRHSRMDNLKWLARYGMRLTRSCLTGQMAWKPGVIGMIRAVGEVKANYAPLELKKGILC